jgi:rhamnosyltransferase
MLLVFAAMIVSRLRAYANHYGQKLATVLLGTVFVSGPGQNLRRRLPSFRREIDVSRLQIAIIAHVYYVELLPEILACRKALRSGVALHVTAPFDRFEAVKRALEGEEGIVIHAVANRGRDIAPFLSVLNSGALDRYDAVLKIHTKSSPHLRDGAVRRKLLFAILCGEQRSTFRALAAFLEPRTGMVGWASCFRTNPIYWMSNRERMREVAQKMDALGSFGLGFFEGSMFWFRPAAFERLRALDLSPEDFEPEAKQLDGTLHHAIERCFTIAAWASGYVVRDMKGRLLPRE